MAIVAERKPKMEGDLVDPRSRMPDRGDLVPPHHQKGVQRQLDRSRQQGKGIDTKKALGDLAKVAASPQKELPKQVLNLVFNMIKQIDLLNDWPFLFVLIPMAALKDILDIVFAGAGAAGSWIPVLGQAIIAMGIIVTFIGEIFILILTVTALVIMGESLKNRGAAAYAAYFAVAFLSEALPIGFLPLCFIETVILYLVILVRRALQNPERKQKQLPEYATS
jgi:hypothetical protein